MKISIMIKDGEVSSGGVLSRNEFHAKGELINLDFELDEKVLVKIFYDFLNTDDDENN